MTRVNAKNDRELLDLILAHLEISTTIGQGETKVEVHMIMDLGQYQFPNAIRYLWDVAKDMHSGGPADSRKRMPKIEDISPNPLDQ